MNIGVMQGRLLPPVSGRIQAFPGEAWEDEFRTARRLALSSIEWILETPLESNPLWSSEGRDSIRSVVNETGVRVDFVCADFFMEEPLVRMTKERRESNEIVLKKAIESCADLGVKGVEIPMVDASRIETREEEDELISALEESLHLAEHLGVEVGLETSLGPDQFRSLLERIDHPAIRANYDSGNSASLGFDPRMEFEAYGKWINNVHIKDRVVGGTTVPFGQGDADIPLVLALLDKLGYAGGYVLQGARQNATEDETVGAYQRQVEEWLHSLS